MSGNQRPMAESKIRNYHSERGAEAYKADYENKLHRKFSDRRERAIFARFFEHAGHCESVLDLPCGAGRLFSMLQAHANEVIEADFSPSMLSLNQRDHNDAAAGYLQCSGLDIPLADNRVELVVSIRLSHHLEAAADRERHVRELFRVARRHVIVTWFSHSSLKNRLRQLRAPFNKKQPKNTLHNRQVRGIASDCGFETIEITSLSRLGSGHAFGLFRAKC